MGARKNLKSCFVFAVLEFHAIAVEAEAVKLYGAILKTLLLQLIRFYYRL